MKHHTDDIFKGLAGVGGTLLGVISSMQEQLQYGLQIFSLMVGIAVGLASLWSILKKKKE